VVQLNAVKQGKINRQKLDLGQLYVKMAACLTTISQFVGTLAAILDSGIWTIFSFIRSKYSSIDGAIDLLILFLLLHLEWPMPSFTSLRMRKSPRAY